MTLMLNLFMLRREGSDRSYKLHQECHRAKSFAKHPSKIQRHPATNMILPDFHLMNPDNELALFQPYLSVLVSKNMPHEDASTLLKAYFGRSASKSSGTDMKLFNKVWTNFISPWFGFSSLDSSDTAVKYTPGQKVRTVVGDGEIVSVKESKDDGNTPDSFKYLVKFSFGVGYVLPSGIDHILSSSDMDTGADGGGSDAAQLMVDDIQVLFGTEKMYIFIRLYILLVTMLYQAKDIVDRKNAASSDKPDIYAGIVSSLQEMLLGKMDAKAFEVECRKWVEKDVYNFVAIPPLVEKCAGALIKMAREDQLESLYHCSQLKLKVRSFLWDVVYSEVFLFSLSLIQMLCSNRILISSAISHLT